VDRAGAICTTRVSLGSAGLASTFRHLCLQVFIATTSRDSRMVVNCRAIMGPLAFFINGNRTVQLRPRSVRRFRSAKWIAALRYRKIHSGVCALGHALVFDAVLAGVNNVVITSDRRERSSWRVTSARAEWSKRAVLLAVGLTVLGGAHRKPGR